MLLKLEVLGLLEGLQLILECLKIISWALLFELFDTYTAILVEEYHIR